MAVHIAVPSRVKSGRGDAPPPFVNAASAAFGASWYMACEELQLQFVRTCEYSTKARLHISPFPEHVNKPAPLVTWAAPASRDKDAVLSEHASYAATRRKRIQHRVAPACVILDLVDSRNRRAASVLTTLLNWTVRTWSGTSSSRAKGWVEEIPGRKALNTVMTSCLASMIVHVSCVVPDTLTERFGS